MPVHLKMIQVATATAAANMAIDLLLLEAFPLPDTLRGRFYHWANPSATFGYPQRFREVQPAIGGFADYTRRPTGGGIVDHRNTITWSFVFPARHPAAVRPPRELYEKMHGALANALNQLAHPAVSLAPAHAANPSPACFTSPSPHDVILARHPEIKIAGAAMKRTRHGVLLQGSITKSHFENPALSEILLQDTFFSRIASAFASSPPHSITLHEAVDPILLRMKSNAFSSLGWVQKR